MDRRQFLKTSGTVAAGAGVLPLFRMLPAEAAPKGVLIVVSGSTINSMDIHRKGTNRPSYVNAVNLYDRLIEFGVKKKPDGSFIYDYSKLVPGVAESWEMAKDGMSVTFKIRKNGVFADGSPITAHDVKWSFDRAVSVGGFPSTQMKAGSLEKPEQFVVVDDKTFMIKFLRKSKLTLPDLAVPVPMIINSKVAKKHATEKDPWATEYLHRNPAGSGPFKLERWNPGQQVVYTRNDKWTQGPKPAIKRVILREVPSQSTRRALIERGDAHMAFPVALKDANELRHKKNLKVIGTPIENCMYIVGLNFKFKPFQDKKVRQAIAWAIPYEEIFKNAAYKRGVPMWGGKSTKPESIAWPQPFPYKTDLDKAKALLAETPYKDGFKVPLSINLGLADWTEPTALLIQEGLAKIGIKASIEKIPGATWRTASLVEKRLAFHLETFGGWLNYPDYYFFWAYLKGHLFNSSNYHNPEIEKLVAETLYIPVDDPAYAPKIKRMIEIAFDDVPRIPLWQPYDDIAMQKNVEGYTYFFHRQLVAANIKLT
jgi:peptide/nickel transport system substrate-binding protein